MKFRRLAILGKRVAIGSPVLLSKLHEKEGGWWAHHVEIDPTRAVRHQELIAAQDARMVPPPVEIGGTIEAVDGDAVCARLDDGRTVWFRSGKCRDHRGHTDLRVRVTLAPERVQAVVIAPEDVEKNARLRKELEPKPLAPITWPSRGGSRD